MFSSSSTANLQLVWLDDLKFSEGCFALTLGECDKLDVGGDD